MTISSRAVAEDSSLGGKTGLWQTQAADKARWRQWRPVPSGGIGEGPGTGKRLMLDKTNA
ncbi:MAG: hypothetical protein JO356_10560 [Acidobacteria bacterium]|nr:hypothetical protein [Acidobacteriota bacterium]